jgi:hypothetical protein
VVAEGEEGFAALEFAKGVDDVGIGDRAGIQTQLGEDGIIAPAEEVGREFGGGDNVEVVVTQSFDRGFKVEVEDGVWH